MPRLTPNFAAAFAAVIITLVSIQAITVVPEAPVAIATVPALA